MKKQARAILTREALIDTASELLASKGAAGTTFDAISERSGISRGSIRFHFGSKNGLLLAVVERVFNKYESHIETQLIGTGEQPSTIMQVLESHHQFITQNETTGRLFFVLMFEALGPNPELLPRFIELYGRLRALAAEWIDAAEASGTIDAKVDPMVTANIMLGVFGGLHYQWHLDKEHMDMTQIYKTLNGILQNGLAPQAVTKTQPHRKAKA